MEEIYVIKLRGLPPPVTPSSSSNSETRDLLFDAILGLGVMHLVLGLVAILLGALGLVVEFDASHTGAGIWCGTVFSITGVAAILASKKRSAKKTKLRVSFGLSVVSMCLSTVYLAVSCLGVSYFHAVRREPNQMTRIGGNAIITGFVEAVVSLMTTLAVARALWPCFWLSMRCPEQSPGKQKVIVSADVLSGGCHDDCLDALRHISPNCVISFKQMDTEDPQKLECVRRVEEYVRNGCVWAGVNSSEDSLDDPSDTSSNSSFDEDDNGIDYVSSENFRNETLQIRTNGPNQTDLIPYYPKDSYSDSGC